MRGGGEVRTWDGVVLDSAACKGCQHVIPAHFQPDRLNLAG